MDSLGGRYITSFDVGTTLKDVQVIGEATAHVGGIKEGAGDAAESTAQGVFECLSAAVAYRWPGRDVSGVHVAIQGVGSVGAKLARRLAKAGARITVADAVPARAQSIGAAVGAQVADAEAVMAVDCDVFAPCALGGVLGHTTIQELQASVIVGGANNQLADPSVAAELQARHVVYVPDYLANAGGIIDLHYQINDVPRELLAGHLTRLGRTTVDVLSAADRASLPTSVIADRIAEERIAAAREGRSA